MQRKPMVAGNWKMNMLYAQSVTLAQGIVDRYDKTPLEDVEVVLCPPFTSLKGVSNVVEFDRSSVRVGAQAVHEEMPEGTAAATGEISAAMLSDMDCVYCIVGHSERRAANGETDALVNAKARLLLERGISPIVCCGESEAVRDAGGSVGFVCAQIREALVGIEAAKAPFLVVAYEPIWAIGTGRVPTPADANSICAAIRGVAAEAFGAEASEKVRVLYGGSVKAANAAMFFEQPDIDGGLIGGASLDASEFVEIVRICREKKIG